jgi:hypothetical protein
MEVTPQYHALLRSDMPTSTMSSAFGLLDVLLTGEAYANLREMALVLPDSLKKPFENADDGLIVNVPAMLRVSLPLLDAAGRLTLSYYLDWYHY